MISFIPGTMTLCSKDRLNGILPSSCFSKVFQKSINTESKIKGGELKSTKNYFWLYERY